MSSGESGAGVLQEQASEMSAEVRRRQLVDAAVALFVRNGYHETTTRDIAQAAGWSVGALYEFVKSKSDVLYHVCEVIHEESEALLRSGQLDSGPPVQALRNGIDTYYRACDARQDVILLIYQESGCLSPQLRARVIQGEERMASSFASVIRRGVREQVFAAVGHREASLAAHNIVVLGQMWAFRRWYLRKHFSIDEYIEYQSGNILGSLT